jgi:hypothetical protein
MSYVLVDNGTVINGPRVWNWRSFEGTLQEDLGITFKLPLTKTDQLPIEIAPGVRILWAEYVYPQHNSKIEYLNGPFWNFDNDIATGTFEVLPIELDFIKATLKQKVAENRWRKEVAGTTATIQNTVVTVDTNRGSRDIFVQKYLLMGENDIVGWKFPEGWMTLTKTDLGIAVATGAAHVEGQFQWEAAKAAEIDACQTAAELDAVDLGYPVEPRPILGPIEEE